MRCDLPDRHTAPAAGRPRKLVREPLPLPFAPPDLGWWVSLTVSASHPAWVCTPAARVAVDRFDFSALASVHPTIAPHRTARCPRKFVRPLLPLRHWLHSVRRHGPAQPSDTPCRIPHRNETRVIPSLLRATPSATSEH